MPADPKHYRAARNACRVEAPDLFFAAHFLPRQQRHDVFVLRAVCKQLQQIIEHQETPPAEEISGGGCSTCGETPEQRRAVCGSVLDFLYTGQKTGKPELDGFHEVAQRLAVPRRLFDDFTDGTLTQFELKLFATWNRLRTVCNQSAGSAALIAWRALADIPGGAPENAPPVLTPVAEQQILAWAAALRLTAILCNLGHDARQNKLLLPLDDLVKFNLDRKEIAAFAAARTTSGDPRRRGLLQFEIARIHNLHRGGASSLQTLTKPSRGAAAVLGETYLGRLLQLERHPDAAFGEPTAPTLWTRLSRLPAAVAAAGRKR